MTTAIDPVGTAQTLTQLRNTAQAEKTKAQAAIDKAAAAELKAATARIEAEEEAAQAGRAAEARIREQIWTLAEKSRANFRGVAALIESDPDRVPGAWIRAHLDRADLRGMADAISIGFELDLHLDWGAGVSFETRTGPGATWQGQGLSSWLSEELAPITKRRRKAAEQAQREALRNTA